MQQPFKFQLARHQLGTQPRLFVVIDTEEEFDWQAPFDRNAISTENLKEQWRAQEILDSLGIAPLYVVDYPAAHSVHLDWLKETVQAGRANVGAHLHPWVTPPIRENLSAYHSYAGNLSKSLEAQKLAVLTDTLEEKFGTRPTAYRAGRYGLGKNTGTILQKLGYRMDLSTCPHMGFCHDGGPSFYGWPDAPFWLTTSATDQQPNIVSIPGTVAFAGYSRKIAQRYAGSKLSAIARRSKLTSIAARLRLAERIRISPEVTDGKGMIRAMRAAIKRQDPVIVMTWHSSSLLPSKNIYTQNEQERAVFLQHIQEACQWFIEAGGAPICADELLNCFLH